MNIYDCFMYFDEDLILDLRLNYLSKYVHKFIIVESTYNHNGAKKKLQFDKKKFKKFEDKIIYIPSDKIPTGIQDINDQDSEREKSNKYIMNAIKRENFQRNQIMEGLNNAEKNDWIIVSDLDEVPNLEKLGVNDRRSKLVFFKQQLMYYKFNLKYENFTWIGSKACRMKDLISPQWLRNIKDRNYPWWRLDSYFSNLKYTNIKFIEDGGWHFSYIKTPELIEKKLKSYLHHREYDLNPIGIEKIKKIIENKNAIYNLNHDQRSISKIGSGEKLTKVGLNNLPDYIALNKNKFKNWLEE